MTKNRFLVKNIYLGWVQYLEENDNKIVAFEKREDFFSKTPSYLPVHSDIGYYYVQTMEPIRKVVSKKLGSTITLRRLDDMINKMNKEKTNFILSKEMEQVDEVVTERPKDNYEFVPEVVMAKEEVKVMRYEARKNRKAA